MEYPLFPTVHAGGIAETGLTCVVNDRTTKLTVPWAATTTGQKNIVWKITSDDGNEYTITVPVNIVVSGNSTTVTYTKGTYTRVVVS